MHTVVSAVNKFKIFSSSLYLSLFVPGQHYTLHLVLYTKCGGQNPSTSCVLSHSRRHSLGNHIFVLLQKLEGKAEQICTLVAEHETNLSAEINQKRQIELKIASQVEEMETLAAETLQLNETLKAVCKKHQGKKCGNISAYFNYIKIWK